MNLLKEAIQQNNIEVVNKLLFKVKPDIIGNHTNMAYYYCHTEYMNLLLQSFLKFCTNPNRLYGYDETALMFASYNTKNTKYIKILLRFGANPYIRNKHGMNALTLACYYGYNKNYKILKRMQILQILNNY